MKKFKLLLWVFAAMLAGTQTSVAQNWTGATPESMKDKTGTDGEVYLWNVGTGQFLYTGGLWGTQGITFDTGTPFHIVDAQNGKSTFFSFQSPFSAGGSPAYIGLTDGTANSSTHDTGIWYLDRNQTQAAAGKKDEIVKDLLSLKFTQVQTGDRSFVYNISVNVDNYDHGSFWNPEKFEDCPYEGKSIYLVATAKNKTTTISESVKSNDKNAQWIIVTLADIRNNFRNGTADAAGANPLDASYILYDQNFMRNNADLSYWYTGSVKGTPDGSLTYSGFKYPDPVIVEDGKTKYTNGLLSPSDNKTQYYVGNGYDPNNATWENLFQDDQETPLKEGESHPKLYGAYWTANIKGDGTIWQKVRVPVEYTGWYIISCDGLTTKTEGTVNLFAATYSDDNLTKQITKVVSPFTTVTGTADAPETYTEAGQLLFTNENYGKQVLIYIDSDKSDPYLVLGVEAAGVNNDSWTCVDNFQIRYAGNPQSDIILDENRTDIAYINAQVDNAKSYTLRLNRAFIDNAWNSLILPVDLTAQQLHLTFGNNVKLSEKKTEASSNPYVIEFKSIDLSNKQNDEIVLHAGVPYIIKPSRLLQTTPAEGGDTYQIRNTQESVTFDKPYYTINQVTLGKAVEATVTSTAYDCGNAGSMYFKGTYTKQTKENGNAPKKNSYLLSEGKWFHMTVNVNSVKGFRTWLEPAENTESNANMQFSVDGVIDGDVTNSIDGIENGFNSKADNKVYNMNGQLVRNGSTSLEGLPKGVYIVNNKKYIVK